MSNTFREVLSAARESVTDSLNLMDSIMAEVADAAPGMLSKHLKLLFDRKGKRIRATFLFLLSQSNGKSTEYRIAKVAAAIELLHLASLVHDDIIDESDTRRNEKTAHLLWGNRIAILVGDYALSKSMEMVWEDEDRRIPLSIARASGRLVAGEVQEIEEAGNSDLTLDEYIEVIEGKTASLMIACAECAAILAGLDEEKVAACGEMGRDFGIAFQVIDDLLDYGIGASDLGKKTHSDLKNGLFTLPLIHYFSKSSPDEKKDMLDLLDDSNDLESKKKITDLLWIKGSFESAKDIAQERIENCFRVLDSLPETEAVNHMKKMCDLMTIRAA